MPFFGYVDRTVVYFILNSDVLGNCAVARRLTDAVAPLTSEKTKCKILNYYVDL